MISAIAVIPTQEEESVAGVEIITETGVETFVPVGNTGTSVPVEMTSAQVEMDGVAETQGIREDQPLTEEVVAAWAVRQVLIGGMDGWIADVIHQSPNTRHPLTKEPKRNYSVHKTQASISMCMMKSLLKPLARIAHPSSIPLRILT
jgi:hypothetical protein